MSLARIESNLGKNGISLQSGVSVDLRNCSTKDLRNAVALFEYLQRCHRAALEVPGVNSELRSTQCSGPHCADPAYVFISTLLFDARSRCEHMIKVLEKTK